MILLYKSIFMCFQFMSLRYKFGIMKENTLSTPSFQTKSCSKNSILFFKLTLVKYLFGSTKVLFSPNIILVVQHYLLLLRIDTIMD